VYKKWARRDAIFKALDLEAKDTYFGLAIQAKRYWLF
jgi:hypothetical protein